MEKKRTTTLLLLIFASMANIFFIEEFRYSNFEHKVWYLGLFVLAVVNGNSVRSDRKIPH